MFYGQLKYYKNKPHTGQNGYHKKSTNKKCWRVCEEIEPFYTVDGNVNWCSHYGEQYECYFKN